MYWFGWNWSAAQILFIASAAMLLRSRVRICLVTAPILGGCLASVCDFYPKHASSAQLLYGVFYGLVGYVLYPAALYGAVRAVVFVDQLFAARAELAKIAVERERLRVSRDLHDLLGHSLSAISLKGDLARKLLLIDADRAFSEIDGLTKVARDALHDMFAISKGQHSVSLGVEIEAAAGLLRAAGICVSIEAVSPEPAQPVREVLAWAVREGATNVLRHSEAMNCSIRLGDATGAIWLEIVNDGLRGPLAPHSGLRGLATRAEAVSGMVEVGVTDGSLFRLCVRIPKKKRDARPLPTPVDRTAGTPMRQPTRWQPS
jgi:two-component system sensor histidine kinase DesK